jgi:hypothetical protein
MSGASISADSCQEVDSCCRVGMEVARVCDQCFGKVAEGPLQRRSREYACQWWKRELVEVSSDGDQHRDLLTKRLKETIIERRGGEHIFV